jgi:hypothetical protein
MSSICTPEFNDQTRKLRERAEKLRAELKATQKEATRMTVLEKQIAADKARVEAGDTTPRPKREPVIYGDNVKRATAERNKWRKQADNLIAQGERANRGTTEKVVDGAIKLQRLFILSHISALQKLPVAAAIKIISSRAEEGVGSVIKHIPGIKQVAEMAPRHGAGFSVKGDVVEGAKGIGEAFRKGAWDQLRHGSDELDNIYGDKHQQADEWANLSGRVHSMMKEPAKLDEFYRSFYKRSQHAKLQFLKNNKGATDTEAQAYIDRPSTKYMIGEAAYKDAKEAIMQGDNALVDAVDNGLRHLSNSSVGGKIFEKVFNILVPIKKVPANIVKETSSYAGGAIKAAVAARNGLKDMTPEQADYIMKNLKKQGVGAAIMAAGYLAGPSILGGLEDAFEDSKKSIGDYYDRMRGKKPLPSHVKIGDTDLNANFSHATPMVIAQAGAQFRAMREKEKNPGVFDGIRDMLQIAGSYAVNESPVLGSLAKTYKYAEEGRKMASVAGNTLAGAIVPGAVQDVAKARDYDRAKDNNPNSKLGHFLDVWGGQFSASSRHPKTVVQDVQKAIPGKTFGRESLSKTR